ncbi:MAG: hypothetical protein IKC86_09600, partial [Prevotella sp.]|nr:hypothetical protein [Prevotella sp.]
PPTSFFDKRSDFVDYPKGGEVEAHPGTPRGREIEPIEVNPESKVKNFQGHVRFAKCEESVSMPARVLR